MKYLLLSMMFMFTNLAFGQLSTSGLTREQKAEMQLQIERLKTQNETVLPNITKENVKEYAELGEAIAQALGSCAKEMNMAVNDFADTKVGTIATILIIWKIAGKEMMKYVVGVSFFCIMLCLWVYFFRKICVVKQVHYNKEGKKERVEHYSGCEVDGTRGLGLLVLIAIVGISCMIMFAF